jgi:hypothetical protein
MSPPRASSRPDGERDSAPERRAQTTVDFAIGAGIFLLVVAFVFAFIPGTFTPFVDADQPQSADRAAATLAGGELGNPDQPYVLDHACTATFFDHFRNGANAPATCRFDHEAGTLNEALGVPNTTNVNVSIRHQDGTIRSINHDGNTITLAAGEGRPPRTPMTSARRTVWVDGAVSRLVVYAW